MSTSINMALIYEIASSQTPRNKLLIRKLSRNCVQVAYNLISNIKIIPFIR